MWVDTHTHLYSKQLENDLEQVINRMIEAKVVKAYMPNIDSTSIEPMFRLEQEYPEICTPMMGLHPCSVKENYKQELNIVETQLASRPFVAVGEIGIDLYWDKSTLAIQRDAFQIQTKWASELNLPIVIHARESIDILIKEVEKVQDGSLKGVFHCFTGSVEQAERIIELGFYMGIGGVVTFKKSGLDKTVSEIPLEHIVLETDSPYLSPTPYRGKRNESSYIPIIGIKLAEIYDISLEEVAAATTQNANALYNSVHSPS